MIIPNLPIEAYHAAAFAGPDRWLSKTAIRAFDDHGPKWWNLVYNRREFVPKPPGGVEQGLALDCCMTEGESAFRARYVIKPDGPEGDGRTAAGKAWKAANSEKLILSQDDYFILLDAFSAIRSLPEWPEIERAKAQQTIRRKADGAPFGVQSRPDWLDAERGIVWDLKKTRDLSRFGAQAIDLGYHLQAALAGHCLAGDGIAMDRAYLVAVEWERGARAIVRRIPDEALDYAWGKLNEEGIPASGLRKTCGEIARRIESGDWEPAREEPQELEIPEWIRRKMEAV